MKRETLLGLAFPILLDGAMGTQLESKGFEMGGPSNLAHPDAALSIHRAYVEAGCGVLTANTFSMNRIYIETHQMGMNVHEVNAAGVELARQAAGGACRVLGDVGPTGQLLEPYGECAEEDAFAAFKEQAEILSLAGVDGFLVETMLDLREALCAVRACRAAADLPVIVTLSFETAERGGRTVMGNSAAEIAGAAQEAGAAAVGANCGSLDPLQTAQIIAEMKKACALPIVAQPNAGLPRLAGGRTVFDMSPADFAGGIAECLKAGARMVGGCCGSTPEHIRQTRSFMDRIGKSPSEPAAGGAIQ